MVVNVSNETKNIIDRFGKAGVQLNEKEVSDRLALLIEEYKVPVTEAVRTVTGFFRQKHGLKFEDVRGGGSAELVKIGTLRADNTWVTVRAKVVQLWEPMNEVINQTGIVGDETGIVKFTVFAKNAGLGTLEEGKSYELNNFVTSIWQNQMSIKGNRNSSIKEIDEKIEAARNKDTIVGVITHLMSGSGLIKRCPECNRKLVKGACGEHGRVEGIWDLRIKAVMEPYGKSESLDLIINREITEQLTGITLENAREMATEALDQGIVQQEIERKIPGHYYVVTGAVMPSNNMLVDSIKPTSVFTAEKAKAAIAALEGGI